mgnify:FL=1
MCSGIRNKCRPNRSFQQLSSQANSILETLCREDTWEHIERDNRQALMRLLADLVAGMVAACNSDPDEEATPLND